MCTPFDEASVPVIEEQDLDIIKVASCSFGDWPCWNVLQTGKPIIASTAGATLEQIDQVVSFLEHRNKDFAIMHCVGEPPTPDRRCISPNGGCQNAILALGLVIRPIESRKYLLGPISRCQGSYV